MEKVILLNCLMNGALGVIFVLLNNWALQNGLEETFISLAIGYGIVTILGNALYIGIFCKKQK